MWDLLIVTDRFRAVCKEGRRGTTVIELERVLLGMKGVFKAVRRGYYNGLRREEGEIALCTHSIDRKKDWRILLFSYVKIV